MTSPSFFIGCDVGKAEIVAFFSHTGTITTVANTPESLARFVNALDPGGLVICEATGGYEAALLATLADANYPAHRADARKVKAFIRSYGGLAKTDALDARALARYGEERHDRLARWVPADEAQQRLHALIMTRRDIVAGITAWNNRRKAPGAMATQHIADPIRDTYRAQLRAVDAEIAKLVKTTALAAKNRILTAIIGIGTTTAASILALLPELGTLTGKQAASLAGLAPHPKQSGQMNAYRPVKGGRPALKNALFMAAMAAAKHNPVLQTFFQRLIANGKKPIVAITAVMRKLINIANAKIRDAQLS